jgi:hypothetical protein
MAVLRRQPRTWVGRRVDLFQHANRNVRVNLRGVEAHVWSRVFFTTAETSPYKRDELSTCSR